MSIRPTDDMFEAPEIPYLTEDRQVQNTGGESFEIVPSDPTSSDSGSSATRSSDDDEAEWVNHDRLSELIMDQNNTVEFVPIIITVAGVPNSGKSTALHDLFDKYESAVSQTKIPAGISMYEFAACHDDQKRVQYVPTSDDTCYLHGVFSALSHRYRARGLKMRMKIVNSSDQPKKLFGDESLNSSLRKLFEQLQKVEMGETCNKFFKKFLPTGVAFINMWNVGLSKAFFHFLPCLIGKFTKSYLWLFLSLDRDVQNLDLPPKIPENHGDLMLWRSRLYYLLQHVYFTTGLKAQSSIRCSVFSTVPTDDQPENDQLIKQYKEEMIRLAKKMNIEHLIDPNEFHLVSSKKSPDSNRCELLKHKADEIVNEGFRSPQQIKLSWIFLRNLFYETNTLYVRIEELKQKAKALKIEDLDQFCLFFSSFASIIDTSLFSCQSPYIITKPNMFFAKLDELFYYEGDNNLCKFGLLAHEVAKHIFGEDVTFFTDILLSASLALKLEHGQYVLANEKEALYYIPIASKLPCTKSCDHSALHFQITGLAQCKNIQVTFTEQFLTCYPSAKIDFTHQSSYLNCTSFCCNSSQIEIVCHDSEVEFILQDESYSEEKVYEAILDSCYAVLNDIIKSETFFSFNFSFLCCQESFTSIYKLDRKRHHLPLDDEEALCERCKAVSERKVLKKWNSMLKEDTKLQELYIPENKVSNSQTESVSSSCLYHIAESLQNLSIAALEKLARLLKFRNGLEDPLLKGFKGWKLITIMILEWERSSHIEEDKTLFFLKRNLNLLRDESIGKDKEILKELVIKQV